MSGKSISGFGHYSNRLAHQCDDVSATIPTAELQERWVLVSLILSCANIAQSHIVHFHIRIGGFFCQLIRIFHFAENTEKCRRYYILSLLLLSRVVCGAAVVSASILFISCSLSRRTSFAAEAVIFFFFLRRNSHPRERLGEILKAKGRPKAEKRSSTILFTICTVLRARMVKWVSRVISSTATTIKVLNCCSICVRKW